MGFSEAKLLNSEWVVNKAFNEMKDGTSDRSYNSETSIEESHSSEIV